MRRPGPLQELPLHLYTTDLSNLSSKSALKRPHSPHTSDLLFSPSKRRILGEEGLLPPSMVSPRNPSESLDAPVISSTRRTKVNVCQTDFSLPTMNPRMSHYDSHNRASRSDISPSGPTTTKLQPSPVLRPQRSDKRSDLYKERGNAVARPAEQPILRRCDSSPDRHSIHYPGFDIYRNESISIQTLDPGVLVGQSNYVVDVDASKENIAPKRRSRKTDALTKDTVLTKSISKQKCKSGWDDTNDCDDDLKTPTQNTTRMLNNHFSRILNTPSATILSSGALSHKSADILERRNAMRMELDGVWDD